MSVKGGKNLNPSMVRDLAGTVEAQKAQMGVLITLSDPTKGMVDAVNHAGSYTHPSNAQTYNKIQIITVPELLSGKRVTCPPHTSLISPRNKRSRRVRRCHSSDAKADAASVSRTSDRRSATGPRGAPYARAA